MKRSFSARLPLVMLVAFLPGSALLGLYLWFTLGDLLRGHVHPFPTGVAPGLLLFLLLLMGSPRARSAGRRTPD